MWGWMECGGRVRVSGSGEGGWVGGVRVGGVP